jgi:hypothetical protein
MHIVVNGLYVGICLKLELIILFDVEILEQDGRTCHIQVQELIWAHQWTILLTLKAKWGHLLFAKKIIPWLIEVVRRTIRETHIRSCYLEVTVFSAVRGQISKEQVILFKILGEVQ